MNKILIVLFALNFYQSYGQNAKSSYSLRWKIHDTVTYNIAFSQAAVNVADKKFDINDPALQTLMSKIRKELGENSGYYRLVSKIYPSNSNFKVSFSINSHLLGRGTVNNSGDLLTEVDRNSENFYKIFFDLPDSQLSIGDKWKTNMQIQKRFRGVTITDSARVDEASLENIVIENGKQVAQIKFELSEKYNGHYPDNSEEKNCSIQVFYNALGYFNITDGKWKKLDGVVVFDTHVLEEKKVVMKVGLVEK